jgi:hypothetical protein
MKIDNIVRIRFLLINALVKIDKSLIPRRVVFLILIVFSLIANNVYSQHKKSKSDIMRDSLWTAVYNFCLVVDKYLDKDNVTQTDVTNFLSYIESNMVDSVQSTESWIPYTVSKNQALVFLTEQTKDMIGQKCNYSFLSWDGWDGRTPYTGFRLDVLHNGYKDQFLVIVNTTNHVHCIFSANSKI